MTKTQVDPKELKDHVASRMKLLDAARTIGGGLESAVKDHSAKAAEKMNEFGINMLTKYPYNSDMTPRYTSDAFKALSDEDKEAKAREAYEAMPLKIAADVITDIKRNADTLLYDISEDGKRTPRSDLLKIANAKDIIETAKDESRQLLEKYAPFAEFGKLAGKVKDGKKLEQKEEELVKKLASAGRVKDMYDHLKGYNDGIRKAVSTLAGYAQSENPSKEHMIKGIETSRDELKKDISSEFGEDFEDKARKAVAESLKAMFGSGNAEKESKGLNLYHLMDKGYQIGQKDFSEVYN